MFLKTERQTVDRFFVPEEVVSLKLLFDNVRNYAICSGLFAASRHFYALSHEEEIATTALLVIAILLTAMNFMQSVVIFDLALKKPKAALLNLVGATHPILARVVT